MAENKRSYVGLRDLTDASKLADKRKETDELRSVMKREWALNRAFYNGQQWSIWNPEMIRVEELPLESGPKWKVRLISNQIKPGLSHYVAQLTKTRPIINAEPDSGSDNDVKAAQMGESLYEYEFEDKQLNSKLQDALIEAGLSGGFWKITWDPQAGKAMTITVNPQDGSPILDDALADAFLDELRQQFEQMGLPPEQATQMARQVIYLGDIRIEVMTAENVLLDPGANRFEDCKWAICRHAIDPDEIYARWGKRVQPNVCKSTDTQVPFTEDKRPETLREVFAMYIRPCPAVPKGRYVAWVEEPNEILEDMDWPYNFDVLPLVKFPGIYRPNSPYDDPIVTDARSIQKDLNKTLSQINEHKNLTMRPQMLAPIGSLRTKLTSEPGAVFEFNPVGNLVPQWREIPNLPSYVFEHLGGLQQRIDRVFHRMPSQRDELPARTDSGHLPQILHETIADELSPVILGIEDALARAGHLIASYAQRYYEEPRLLKIRGSGGSIQVKKFQGADLAGGFTFRPRYGTGLPRTREGKRQAILELLQFQLIDPRTAMKHLELSDLRGVQAQMAQDEDQAYREHDKILRSIPINQQAIQDAQAQLQQFAQQAQQIMQMIQSGMPMDMNQDGQPDDPNSIIMQLQDQLAQLQQALQNAPWQPLFYENSPAHMDVHTSLAKSVEFEGYPPEIQAIILKHVELTQQKIQAEQPQDPANLPKVNLQLKGTTSAPVMAKLLQSHGIQASEDEVAQLPLDTEVYDSLDKPNANESGNDPISEVDAALKMQQAQDQHIVAMAKAGQAMGIAEQRQAQAEDLHSQKMSHAEDQQAQKSAQGEESHRAKLKAQQQAAKKPPSKGK